MFAPEAANKLVRPIAPVSFPNDYTPPFRAHLQASEKRPCRAVGLLPALPEMMVLVLLWWRPKRRAVTEKLRLICGLGLQFRKISLLGTV